jgi:hypothetical protein
MTKFKIQASSISQKKSIKSRCITLLMAAIKKMTSCSSIPLKDVVRDVVVRHFGIKTKIPKRISNTRLWCR